MLGRRWNDRLFGPPTISLLGCLLKTGVVLMLLAGFIALGKLLVSQVDLAEYALPVLLAVFVLAAATPFVPGAEIGFGLLMVFGAEAALDVYLAMLLALLLAYSSGRLVPPKSSARHMRPLNARWRLARTKWRNGRIRTPLRFAASALRFLAANKHLTLIAALNTPGNSVLGGGGGLAFLAGASRQFSFAGFIAVAAVAVLPVPLAFAILG